MLSAVVQDPEKNRFDMGEYVANRFNGICLHELPAVVPYSDPLLNSLRLGHVRSN